MPQSLYNSTTLELLTQFRDCNPKKTTREYGAKINRLCTEIFCAEARMRFDHSDVKVKKQYLALVRETLDLLEKQI